MKKNMLLVFMVIVGMLMILGNGCLLVDPPDVGNGNGNGNDDTEEVLFFEDFEDLQNIDDNWTFRVRNNDHIAEVAGGKLKLYNPDTDSNWTTSAVTKQDFQVQNGLIMEWEMKIESMDAESDTAMAPYVVTSQDGATANVSGIGILKNLGVRKLVNVPEWGGGWPNNPASAGTVDNLIEVGKWYRFKNEIYQTNQKLTVYDIISGDLIVEYIHPHADTYSLAPLEPDDALGLFFIMHGMGEAYFDNIKISRPATD